MTAQDLRARASACAAVGRRNKQRSFPSPLPVAHRWPRGLPRAP